MVWAQQMREFVYVFRFDKSIVCQSGFKREQSSNKFLSAKNRALNFKQQRVVLILAAIKVDEHY